MLAVLALVLSKRLINTCKVATNPLPRQLLRGLLRGSGSGSGLGLLLLLLFPELLELLSKAVLRHIVRRELLTASQSEDNAGADNEGQDEPVHVVPRWSPALDGGAGVVVVQEGEGRELRDQSIFSGHEKGGPRNGGSDDTGSIAPIANLASISGPFKTPMDGTEEREDLLDIVVK